MWLTVGIAAGLVAGGAGWWSRSPTTRRSPRVWAATGCSACRARSSRPCCGRCPPSHPPRAPARGATRRSPGTRPAPPASTGRSRPTGRARPRRASRGAKGDPGHRASRARRAPPRKVPRGRRVRGVAGADGVSGLQKVVATNKFTVNSAGTTIASAPPARSCSARTTRSPPSMWRCSTPLGRLGAAVLADGRAVRRRGECDLPGQQHEQPRHRDRHGSLRQGLERLDGC